MKKHHGHHGKQHGHHSSAQYSSNHSARPVHHGHSETGYPIDASIAKQMGATLGHDRDATAVPADRHFMMHHYGPEGFTPIKPHNEPRQHHVRHGHHAHGNKIMHPSQLTGCME